MRKLFSVLAVFYTILAVLFCWFVFSHGKAGWLRVESPSAAYCGDSFPLNVTMLNPENGYYVGADLHWIDRTGVSRGFLSGGGSVEMKTGKNNYSFSVPIHGNLSGDAASVFGIIFISKKGSWDTRFKAASVEPVSLFCGEKPASRYIMGPRSVKVITSYKKYSKTESAALRSVLFGMWFSIALLSYLYRRSFQTGCIAAAALVSSIWEALNGNRLASDLFRSISSHLGLYSYRYLPQKIISVAVILLGSIIFFRYILKENNAVKIILSLCILAFWGVTSLRIISLHASDAVLLKNIAGFEAGQIIRIVIPLVGILVFPVPFVVSWYRQKRRF